MLVQHGVAVLDSDGHPVTREPAGAVALVGLQLGQSTHLLTP